MKKIRLNITIDYNAWLYTKSKSINVSKLCNDLLLKLMSGAEENKEEEELKQTKKNYENNILELQSKILLIEDKIESNNKLQEKKKKLGYKAHLEKYKHVPISERPTYIDPTMR